MTTTSTTPADNNLVLLAGRYPKTMKAALLQATAELGYRVLPASIGAFKSGERFCELYPKQQELFAQNKADIAGAHVHIVMPMHDDPDRFFVDAVNTAETIAGQHPASIHMIMPFAPFARQDRDFNGRTVSKMAETLPKHLKCAGVDRVTTFDVHSKQAENYYIDSFGEKNVQFLTMADDLRCAAVALCGADQTYSFAAPDGGDKPHDVAQLRARRQRDRHVGWTDYPDDHMLLITKRHKDANTTEVLDVRGQAVGTTTLMFDDMIDTGGTLNNGAAAAKEKGAERVIGLCTHPILSGDSTDKLTQPDAALDFLITSDTIVSVYDKVRRLPTQAQRNRVKIVSHVPMIKHALAHRFTA